MDPQHMMSRLKALASSLNPGQIASLVGAFLLVVGIIVGGAWWVNAPTYALLYSDMDAEGAAMLVDKLKSLKVPYKLDEGGRAIRVPRERVDELKLELASEGGLPDSGRLGFEIFDRTNFGATEFLEQVNMRRALEGEMAKTIRTLSMVSAARVHISLGKPALFGEPTPAKASVALKLRGRAELPRSAVAGITNLVAASVDNLKPENVTIVDSFGNLLTRPLIDEGTPVSAAQVERQLTLERDLNARVVALLEPVIGHDRVRVAVSMRLNPATVEQTEETYDPTTIVRSRQTTADSTTTTMPGGGVAGVRSNTPPPAPDPKKPAPAPEAQPLLASGGGSGASRSAETVNYEVNRKLVVTQRPPGEIARLSLAVLVDDEQVVKKGSSGAVTTTRKARTPEELEQLQAIVAAGVGLEPERGDTITVRNISFEETPIEVDEPALTPIQQVTRYSTEIWEGARLLAVVILGALAMLFFVRPLMQRASGGSRSGQQMVALAGPGQPLRTVADLEHEIEAQLDASTQQNAEARRLPVLARRVSSMSAKEPENVAKLLRSWINEVER